MFFKLHKENRIGYKQLTDADLGRSPKSNQTHIGLFGDVFTFLPNDIEIDDTMVIFNEKVEFLSAHFNRIENPDHTFRSPKLRTGGRDTVSVVTFIRDKAKDYPDTTNWYLFWFGLESEQLVFLFFNDQEKTFDNICSIGIDLTELPYSRSKTGEILYEYNTAFSKLLRYLEGIVNKSGKEIIQELEVAVQTNEIVSHKYNSTYNPYDIKKAKELFKKTGREGETLIDQYFAKMLSQGRIKYYEWKNKDTESYLPYDFSVETLQNEVFYLDVKTTNYGFEQKMIFSRQEIKFVDSCPNKYYIFRVYSNDEKKCLKICKNAKDLFSPIYSKTTEFESILNEMAEVESIKMAIMPSQKKLVFGKEISL